jgi:hypothetical protein
LISLVDTAQHEISRAATSPSGGFSLTAPRPGTYVVVVRQIGFQAWHSTAFALAGGSVRPLTLRVEVAPYTLPGLTVEARRPRCGIRLEDGAVVARLLDAARTALALAEVAASGDTLGFSTETYRARLTPALEWPETTSTDASRMAAWPIQSIDPDSLRDHGFVSGPVASAGPIYYGPDARVLFSDWFLDSHCFRVEEEKGGVLEVRFTPGRRQAYVDVEGRLILDGRTLELRGFEFGYVGLPRWVPRGKAGRMVWVQRLRGGAWVPYAWRIRAPIPIMTLGRSEPRLDGWAEAGGRVTAVRGPGGDVDLALTRELLETHQ